MSKHNMIMNAIAAAACTFLLLTAVPIASAGRGGSPGVIRSAIRSNNADAIIAALEQSENIPCHRDCVDMVMDLLDDNNYKIRQVAAWWFARRPAQMREVASRASAWLRVGDSVDVRNGADILGTFGYAKYIPELQEAATQATLSTEARAAIIQALGNIRNLAANDTIATAMADSEAMVRLKAVHAWKGMLKQSSAEPVARLVSDPDVAVRRAAVSTLGHFRTSDSRVALEHVVLKDDDAATRRNAAWSLGQIGNAASRGALVAASSDSSSLVRMTAKVALRKLR